MSMNSHQVRELVMNQIGDPRKLTNSHGFDVRTGLEMPRRAQMVWREVRDGQLEESTEEVWIVLRTVRDSDGHMTIYDEVRWQFGLASARFADDPFPVLCGYHDDFWGVFTEL